MPPAVPFLPAAEGDVPCPRARVTFGRSPKSDQKRCLKPQVSRLPARLGALKTVAVYHAKTKIVRIVVQRIACGPLVAAAPAYRAEVRWSTAGGDYRIAHLPPPTSVGAGGKITKGVKHYHCTERAGKFPLWNVGTAAGMGGVQGFASGGSISSSSGRGCSVPSGTGHFWPQPQK